MEIGSLLFIPITKVDVEKRLVYGTLSQEVTDKTGEIMDYASGKESFQEWTDSFVSATKGESKGNLRSMHNSHAVGKFTDIVFNDAAKSIEGVAKIVDDDEWKKIIECVYTGFSIGGSYKRRWADPSNPQLMRYTPSIAEVSLVDNPACPTATFEMIRADGIHEMVKFNSTQKGDPMSTASKTTNGSEKVLLTGTMAESLIEGTVPEELLGKAIGDLDLSALSVGEKKLVEPAIANLFKAADSVADDAAGSSSGGKFVKDGKLLKPAEEPRMKWLSKAAIEMLEKTMPGEVFDKKQDATIRNLEIEAASPLAGAFAKVDEILKGAKKDGDADASADKGKKDEKEEGDANKSAEDSENNKAADKKEDDKKDDKKPSKTSKSADASVYADSGLQADKKKRFNTGTERLIRSAWAEINTDERAKGYGADQLKVVKANIIDAWKKQIDKEGPPDPANKDAMIASSRKALQKGLYQVAELARLIECLDSLKTSCEFERSMEGDESPIPEQLDALVRSASSILVAMTQEETSELFDSEENIEVAVMEMSAASPSRGATARGMVALAKFVSSNMLTLEKAESSEHKALSLYVAALEKAGARHSKADMNLIEKMHKSAMDHAETAHECCMGLGMKGDDEEGESEKAGKYFKMQKDRAAALEYARALEKAVAQVPDKIDQLIGTIEPMQKTITEQAKKIEQLERQPLPPKGSLRSVGKGQDISKSDGNSGSGNPLEAAKAVLDGLSPKDRGMLLLRATLANGQVIAEDK